MKNLFVKFAIVLAFVLPFSIISSSYADSVTYTVIQTFGEDGDGYKVMLQRSGGNRFFLWYAYKIGINHGDQVIVTTSGDYIGYGDKISNPKNGSWSRINKSQPIK